MVTHSTIDAVLQRVDEYAKALLAYDRSPGYALAITDRSETLAFRAWGHLDTAGTQLANEHTLWESGSIGKSFTAVVLLQLAAEGKVDLHAPMADQLPIWQIPSKFEPVTPHHLLTHTSGLHGGTDHVPDAAHELWEMRKSKVKLPPNEKFMYSNLGYKALGCLIEHVEQKPYAEVLRARIFEPLGMEHSHGAISFAIRDRKAPSHSSPYDDRPWIPEYGWIPTQWYETDTADGCLALSAPDLATWLRMFLNQGHEPVLTRDQFEVFTRPHAGETPEPDYGYGITRVSTDGSDLISHSGGMIGAVSHMIGDIKTGFGVVAFNNAHASPTELADFALECLTASHYGNQLPDVPTVHPSTWIEDADRYAGDWFGSETIQVVANNNTLHITTDGTSFQLHRMSRPGLFATDQPGWNLHPVQFVENEDGALTELVCGSRWFVPAGSEVPQETPTPESWAGLLGHYRSWNPWRSSVRIFVRRGKLMLGVGPGWDAQIEDRNGQFVLSTQRSAEEEISFELAPGGRALAMRFDDGTVMTRFFTP